jgi:hypothetical protein
LVRTTGAYADNPSALISRSLENENGFFLKVHHTITTTLSIIAATGYVMSAKITVSVRVVILDITAYRTLLWHHPQAR